MAREDRLPKRFYTDVTVTAQDDGAYSVQLDAMVIRTPARSPLRVPDRAIAEAIAAEWIAQETVIDPATMPMTRLSNTVIEGVSANADPIREDIGRYVDTDLLLYRAEWPDLLVERQNAAWNPILDWAKTDLGAQFVLAQGVIPVRQPDATLAAIGRALEPVVDPFRLAALHQATSLTGSGLLAIAVDRGRLDTATAWRLAHVDEDWNIEQWGADEEAAARRERRWQDMRVAGLILERRLVGTGIADVPR